MDYKNINWNEKNWEEIDSYLNSLPHDEFIPFFKHLGNNYPEIASEILNYILDMREFLSREQYIATLKDFVAWFPQKFPELYAHRYEFTERDLCNYYLFTEELDKLQERIKIIKANPAPGFDTVTRQLFYQLLFHGLYDDAMQYARDVYQPISESKKLIGMPELIFIQAIYINELQNVYEEIKKSGITDISKLYQIAEKYNIAENEEIIKIETEVLNGSLDPDKLISDYKKNQRNGFIALKLHFLKYMLDKYNLPFVLSEELININSKKGLFGQSKTREEFFYIDVVDFSKLLVENVDTLFGTNNLEMFSRVWGLHYTYEFLEKYHLISSEAAGLMRENINYHCNECMFFMQDILWNMTFIFDWPHSQQWIHLKPLFKSTFYKDSGEILKIFNKYEERNPVNPRIKKEFTAHKRSERQKSTVKREKHKVGRNDPCPCGSGKKYKHCCINKN